MDQPQPNFSKLLEAKREPDEMEESEFSLESKIVAGTTTIKKENDIDSSPHEEEKLCVETKCNICNFPTKSKESLKQHLKQVHINVSGKSRETMHFYVTWLDERGYVCSFCSDAVFSTEMEVICRHIRSAHADLTHKILRQADNVGRRIVQRSRFVELGVFMCPFCQSGTHWNALNALLFHIQLNHQEKFVNLLQDLHLPQLLELKRPLGDGDDEDNWKQEQNSIQVNAMPIASINQSSIDHHQCPTPTPRVFAPTQFAKMQFAPMRFAPVQHRSPQCPVCGLSYSCGNPKYHVNAAHFTMPNNMPYLFTQYIQCKESMYYCPYQSCDTTSVISVTIAFHIARKHTDYSRLIGGQLTLLQQLLKARYFTRGKTLEGCPFGCDDLDFPIIDYDPMTWLQIHLQLNHMDEFRSILSILKLNELLRLKNRQTTNILPESMQAIRMPRNVMKREKPSSQASAQKFETLECRYSKRKRPIEASDSVFPIKMKQESEDMSETVDSDAPAPAPHCVAVKGSIKNEDSAEQILKIESAIKIEELISDFD